MAADERYVQNRMNATFEGRAIRPPQRDTQLLQNPKDLRPPPWLPACTLQIFYSIVCILSYYLFGALAAILGPSVPELVPRLGVRAEAMTAAFTAQGLGDMCGSLVWSLPHVSTRLPSAHHYTTAALCILVAGMATVGAAFASTLPVFVACSFLQGVFIGSTDVTANACLLDLWGASAGPWMQTLHAAFGLGCITSPVIVGTSGAGDAYVLFGAMCVAPLMSLSLLRITERLPPALPFPHRTSSQSGLPMSTSDDTDSKEELEGAEPGSLTNSSSSTRQSPMMHHCRGRRRSGQPLDPLPPAPSGQVSPGAYGPMPRLMELVLCVAFFAYVAAEVGYAGWLSTVLLEEGATASKPQAAFTVSVFWGAITAGRLLAVPISAVVSSARFLQCQLLLSLLGCLLYLTLGRHTMHGTQVTSALYGLGLGPQFPLLMSLPGELGIQVCMSTLGRFVVLSNLGEALGPLVLGYSIGAFGPYPTFALYGLFCTLVIVAALFAVLQMYRQAGMGQKSPGLEQDPGRTALGEEEGGRGDDSRSERKEQMPDVHS